MRRWGGDAEILVAEVGDFKPIAEVTASRARARRQVRIDKLQAQITALEAETETCPSRAAAASPWAERANET
ncbi:hypothetical protein DWQ67_00840 [Galactobacter caseinivorans]|uniref:Uncharacterized protein n=1 Tax=Galactobacter caseinivorans TaxID=2676123 RepID=A0A496PLT5_9MICC|nr:hypothetical protein DWQ67_00840 [Galactobacter caseinivorans]